MSQRISESVNELITNYLQISHWLCLGLLNHLHSWERWLLKNMFNFVYAQPWSPIWVFWEHAITVWEHTVRSLAPIWSSLISTIFSEPIFRQSHTIRQRHIHSKEYSVPLLGPSWLISVVTNNTSFPCSTRKTEVTGGQAGTYARSELH